MRAPSPPFTPVVLNDAIIVGRADAPAERASLWAIEPSAPQTQAAVDRLAPVLLSSHERTLADRRQRPEDRSAFCAGRVLLRSVLTRLCGGAASKWAIDATPGERPRIAGAPGVSFSLSHTPGLTLLALSFERTIGVDCESRDRVEANIAPGANWLAAEELAMLDALPATGRTAALARLWVAKEALAKASGMGLRLDLSALSFAVTRVEARLLAPAAALWSRLSPRLRLFEPIAGRIGGLASLARQVT